MGNRLLVLLWRIVLRLGVIPGRATPVWLLPRCHVSGNSAADVARFTHLFGRQWEALARECRDHYWTVH
jgi:hypothetical protein